MTLIEQMRAALARITAASTPEDRRGAERELARLIQAAHGGDRREPEDWAKKAANDQED